MKIELYNNINFNNYNLKSTNKRILILPKNIIAHILIISRLIH